MNDIILIISTFSLYALVFIVLSLIAINVILVFLKRMTIYFVQKKDQYQRSSKDFRRQMQTIEEKLDKIDCENKNPSVDCEECELKPISDEVNALNLKMVKLNNKARRLKIFVDIVLWMLLSPFGKILLYFGNVDLKIDSAKSSGNKP